MASDPPPEDTRLEQELLTLISERLLEPHAGLGFDADLYVAGLDSMAIMQLLVLVEQQYGVSLPEGDLTRHNLSTIRHLADLIRERGAKSR
jgi:acyl carrier protein